MTYIFTIGIMKLKVGDGKMKLHVGDLYWPKVSKIKKIKTEDKLILKNKDLLIVGAGISGALSAYYLSQAGYRVTLIEKNTLASGSTSANTGLIQYMSDKGLASYIEQIGEKEAKFFYLESVEAVKRLIEFDKEIEDLETETFQLAESLIMATEKEKVNDLKEEVEVQNKLGIGAEFIEEKELQKVNLDGFAALKASPDIALNPYGFVNRLIYSAVEKYNLCVLENTEFLEIHSGNDKQIVKIKKDGNIVEADFKKVLFATGYVPPDFLKNKLKKLQVNKTYVTVSEPGQAIGPEFDYLLWEVKTPYTYFRRTFENSIMIGGLDVEEKILKEDDAYKNRDRLISLTRDMLQNKDVQISPQYSYAALFGESKDNLPYMGIDPENENIFLICGAGGNGTVYSSIGAKIALEWMKNKDISKYNIFQLNR